MTVGARIAAWRKVRNLSQQELAELVEVTHAAVYQWEKRQTTPSQDHLEAVAKALGLTMEKFYGRIPSGSARAS